MISVSHNCVICGVHGLGNIIIINILIIILTEYHGQRMVSGEIALISLYT